MTPNGTMENQPSCIHVCITQLYICKHLYHGAKYTGGTGEVPVLLVHDWQKWKSCDADCDVHDGHGLDDSDVHDANDGIDKTVVLVPM